MAGLPLLDWPDLRDAETRVAEATAAWRSARERWRCAPHGHRAGRLAALQTAARTALEADLELARARREASA